MSLIKWRVGSWRLPFAVDCGGRTSIYQVVDAGTFRGAALITLIEKYRLWLSSSEVTDVRALKIRAICMIFRPRRSSGLMASTFPIRKYHSVVHGASVVDVAGANRRERRPIFKVALRHLMKRFDGW
jgi:hypothetical protein